jgi:hypothetical protein
MPNEEGKSGEQPAAEAEVKSFRKDRYVRMGAVRFHFPPFLQLAAVESFENASPKRCSRYVYTVRRLRGPAAQLLRLAQHPTRIAQATAAHGFGTR